MSKVKTSVKTAEIDALSDLILSFYEKEETLLQDSFLKNLFSEIKTVSDEITSSIKETKTESQLEQCDLERDNAVRDLANLLEGYCSFPNETKKAHAFYLKKIFDKFGRKTISESYLEESSLIEALLKDFENDEASEKIASLEGVSEQLEILREANKIFLQVYEIYSKEIAKQGEKRNATSLKKILLSLINGKLIPYLDTMKMLEKTDYAKFTLYVQTEIEKLNSKISSKGK